MKLNQQQKKRIADVTMFYKNRLSKKINNMKNKNFDFDESHKKLFEETAKSTSHLIFEIEENQKR